MKQNLKNLLKHLKTTNNSKFDNMLKLAGDYSNFNKPIESKIEDGSSDKSISGDSLTINTLELESLVNPEKFDYQMQDLGLIALEK